MVRGALNVECSLRSPDTTVPGSPTNTDWRDRRFDGGGRFTGNPDNAGTRWVRACRCDGVCFGQRSPWGREANVFAYNARVARTFPAMRLESVFTSKA